jgi:hypothetical protein
VTIEGQRVRRVADLEVPLPFFLRDAVGGLGLERQVVGAFLAIYIIVYGQMQSYTPQLVIGPLGQTPPNKFVAVMWAAFLVPITLGIGLAVTIAPAFLERDIRGMLGLLIAGIATFAIIFAINSSVHSYLVVRYAAGDKVRAAALLPKPTRCPARSSSKPILRCSRRRRWTPASGRRARAHALSTARARLLVTPTPRVHAGCDGRWLLLYGQCSGQAHRHALVRRDLLVRRSQSVAGLRRVHVGLERLLYPLVGARLPVPR